MEDKKETDIKYPELAKEINQMVKEDQDMRVKALAKAKQGDWSDFNADVDLRNTQRMKEIIEEIDWPTIDKVGKEGSHGAWFLVQHADRDLSFQEKYLKLMKDLPMGEIELRDIAYLEDRVRVNKGDLQLYGTQFYTNDNGKFGPRPIEDSEHVNERRFEVGLETIEDYEKDLRQRHNIK